MKLDNVYAMGLEKFAGDQQKATEFTEGFAKEAGIWDSVKSQFATRIETRDGGSSHGFMPSMMEGMGKGLGGAAIAGGVGIIGMAANSINNGALHNKYMAALQQAISTNPLLRDANREKVIQYGNTIFKFSPRVATDPNIMSSILANCIQGEGLDPLTIKTLVDLEARYKDSTSFSPKTFL
ncbi:MAG: hypothetical protein COX32_02200 [Candidatus Moranbacteria bacterium CG23_combo_of_CG06-09_8_20_14_all_41_28]|nr:MAG: hypothetical protein COX32_02200 [Candidatus Moranbacteria bacterium CG23_combo_of_CG06-09_8_20_14_all_41_28]